MPASLDRRLIAGMRLFDAGEYHDSHEVWEEMWFEEVGETKDLLKALIQIAVALHHRQNGNLRGAELLFSRAGREVLPRVRSYLLGLDARDLELRALRLLQELQNLASVEHPRFDPNLVPRFESRRRDAAREARAAGERLPPEDDAAADR